MKPPARLISNGFRNPKLNSRIITPEELESWILYHDDDLLVLNKPGDIVCHPSKNGPWSSLVGACREYLGAERLHMPARLDRETSGVVVVAKTHELGSRLQIAMQERRVTKTYLAVMHGEFAEPIVVDQAIGLHSGSQISVRRTVLTDGSGQAASTEFHPFATGGGFTAARVHPVTGRAHQIRVHAEWMGHPLVGDKMYGVGDSVFLTFLETGITPELLVHLLLPRQALHAASIRFERPKLEFHAPLAPDIAKFCRERLKIDACDVFLTSFPR